MAGKTPSTALVWGLRITLGAIGLLAALKFLAGAPIEAATVGLAVAAGALIFCLSAMYKMVRVLARPALDFDLEIEAKVSAAGTKKLREDRRRLLRAINELQFDHEMGKISDADYKSVRHSYELRAVEVMRALEKEPELHPKLVKELRKRGVLPSDGAEEQEQEQEEEQEQDERICAACDKANDLESKFCKHCGKELSA